MAVEDILKRIRADAEREAREILERARQEADSISEDARNRVEGEREKLMSAARQRADEERNRIITLAKLEARRTVLSEKQRLIDLVFERVRERVVSMERGEYRRMIAAFLKDAAATGEYEVLVDSSEERIDQSFLDEVASEVPGLTLHLSEERRPVVGGFVLRSGRTETNCSLKTMLRDARERLETDVAESLFGRGE
ncbi:MAG: hypothetical protein GF400_10235 [Candidatus Eisenbacteria bacterium]|nr:hypothetical protein [Candidatus Eisenbacteria bacterium]